MKILLIDYIHNKDSVEYLRILNNFIKNKIKYLNIEKMNELVITSNSALNYNSNNFKKYNVYILCTNNIENLKEFKNYYKKSTVILLTKNMNIEYIKQSIKLTPNICYLNNSSHGLVKKLRSEERV